MSIREYWPITENDVYVRVFDEILDELDHSLFDQLLIEKFKSLSVESRYLVTRMYIRSAKWVRKEDLEKYMAPETVKTATDELVASQWLLSTPPLEGLINDVASQGELQQVAKNLGLQKALNMPRPKLADHLIQMDRQQAMFNSGRVSTKIRAFLPIECFFLEPSRRLFLSKLEHMFLYPVGPDASLDTIFLTHMKKHSFYKYEYMNQRAAPIFKSKEAFESYAHSRELCRPIEDALALTSSKIPNRLTTPAYLQDLEQGFKAASENGFNEAAYCYGRGLFNASQVLMKLHRFVDEYAWVQKYLDQKVHKTKRGVALIRKLLLELRFLTESQTVGESSWLVSAVNTYYDAIAEVSDIEILDLQRKTIKLISSIRNTGLKSALSFVQPPEIKPKSRIPVFEIIAVPLTSIAGGPVAGPGTKLVYDNGLSVEQLALNHYEGYKGGHFENSIMLTIFWLLSYDLLFGDRAQFHCAYQAAPISVQRAIETHRPRICERLESGRITDIVIKHRRRLLENMSDPKPYMGGINWLIPEGSLQAVIRGMGQDKLTLVLQRIMSDYRKYSSGFPDLTLWDNSVPHTKFVEVKSENDTVSDNQLLWMEFLLDLGLDVEICKVIPEKRPLKRKR